MSNFIDDIIKINFPEDQYFREETKKEQIVLHHTVSGIGVDGDISHWIGTTERIVTCIIVDREGKIHQCFQVNIGDIILELRKRI